MRATAVLVAGLLAVSTAACSGSGDDDASGDSGGDRGGAASDDATSTTEAAPELDFASMSDSELATEAYVAGYPLVVSMRTMQTLGGSIGVNRLFWQDRIRAADRGVVVAPNRDTIYSIAVLDLRSEPMAITLPEIGDRYFTYQFLDAWTESFAYLGTRATGGRAGTWVVTPPGWQGELPAGTEQIEASTPLVFMLGRFLVQDEADVANITPIRDQVDLQPLSALAGTPAAPAPPALGAARGTPQDIPADAAFFDELGDALAVNEPGTDLQRELFTQAESLGVGAGRHPAAEGAEGAATATVLGEGATAGSRRIEDNLDAFGEKINGWIVNPDTGVYGDDLLLRATVAKAAYAANVADEALYPLAREDATGAPLNGGQTYTITFPADALPPAEEFWSITPYGPDMFLVDHPSGRFNIGDRTPGLRFEDDGSLVVTLAHDDPGGGRNWLPVPEGDFVLIMRLYLPSAAALDGSYEYPGIEPVP